MPGSVPVRCGILLAVCAASLQTRHWISCDSSHTVALGCWRKLSKVHLGMLSISRLPGSMILSWLMHESMVVRCLSGISQELVAWPTKSRKGCHILRFHWTRSPWQVPTAAKPLVRQQQRNSHSR